MKRRLTLSLLAIAFCAGADSKSSVPLPPGAYAVRMGDGDGHLSVELTCYTDSTCAMRTISESPGIQPLNDVRKLDRIVRLALQYDRRGAHSAHDRRLRRMESAMRAQLASRTWSVEPMKALEAFKTGLLIA